MSVEVHGESDQQPSSDTPFWGPWLPMLLCALINLSVGFVILVNRPAYLTDYRQCEVSDAQHYVLLGRNLLLEGHYSRCGGPPYVADYLRTPVYPLFAGGLDVIGGVGALYFAQAALQVLSCWLVFQLINPFFGSRAAFFASLFLATDLMLSISNFEAMSEPLFLALVLGATYFILPTLLGAKNCGFGSIASGGILLALAILARPAGLYVPFIFAVLSLMLGCYRRRVIYHTALAGLLLGVTLTPVVAWMARNNAVFSVNRLTHADAIMLAYFTGAGAYQVEHGLSLEEAQERISTEFNLSPPNITNNHWLTEKPIAQMDQELRAAVPEILAKYPRSLVISSLLGSAKATFSHNVRAFADMTGQTWSAPGTGPLLRGDPDAFRRLGENAPFLIGAMIWQMAHNLITWLCVLVGVVMALRNRQFRSFSLCLLMLLVYFYLTVAIVGLEAFYRSRTPHLPYLFAFAGLAVAALAHRFVKVPQPVSLPERIA